VTSALDESAKVGTPRYREAEDLCVERTADFPADRGRAGAGIAAIAAIAAASVAFPSSVAFVIFHPFGPAANLLRGVIFTRSGPCGQQTYSRSPRSCQLPRPLATAMFDPASLASGLRFIAPRPSKRLSFIRCDLAWTSSATPVPERNKFSQDETYSRRRIRWYAIAAQVQYERMCFVLNS
jgi:hypothetical protein